MMTTVRQMLSAKPDVYTVKPEELQRPGDQLAAGARVPD